MKLKAETAAAHLNACLKRDPAAIAALLRRTELCRKGTALQGALPAYPKSPDDRVPVCALDVLNGLLEGNVDAVFEKGSSSRIVEFRVKSTPPAAADASAK